MTHDAAPPTSFDPQASPSEAYHFFFDRLLGLCLAGHSRLGLSGAQARWFCRGLAAPFVSLISSERLLCLFDQRQALGPESCDSNRRREAIDSIFALAARSSPSARPLIARLAGLSSASAQGPLDLSFEESPIEAASLPPERAFILLAQLLSCSAGDASAVTGDERMADFLSRYTASMGFVISLCAEESLLDWMPSAVNSICFSRLGWPEQWSSSRARAAYSALYLGLLPKLAKGFSEPEAAFASVLERCAPSYPSIERERAAALRSAAAQESRRRLASAAASPSPRFEAAIRAL